MQRRVALLLLAFTIVSCRYVRPAVPQVTPQRPGLLSSDTSDPTRTPSTMPARRCVVACAPGYRCNEQTAECEADRRALASDAGMSWLP